MTDKLTDVDDLYADLQEFDRVHAGTLHAANIISAGMLLRRGSDMADIARALGFPNTPENAARIVAYVAEHEQETTTVEDSVKAVRQELALAKEDRASGCFLDHDETLDLLKRRPVLGQAPLPTGLDLLKEKRQK